MGLGSFVRRPLFLIIMVIVGALLVGYFFGEPPHRTPSSMDLAEIG